jgi:F-type H+-transporting ATPase subunit epsilon
MSKTMSLDILTPERAVCHVDADMVIVRAVDGEVGILYNHAPLVVALDIAPLRYKIGDEEHSLSVNGGFMEVRNNRISIVTGSAETEAEIDIRRAQAAKARAEKRLAAPEPDTDLLRAELALRRAIMRLKIAEHVRR